MTTIDIEQVKKYNADLRAYQDKAAKISAEIDINTNEINRICAELSRELGVQITVDNIAEVYQEKMSKILDTMKTGTEIMKHIEAEERALQSSQSIQQHTQQPVAPQVQNQPVGTPFTGFASLGGETDTFGNLPPMFSNTNI